MSVEAIVHAVEVTAAAESDAIAAAARADAASIVAAAEAAADARIREACERADPGFRAEAMRQVNTARLRLLERRAARSAELVERRDGRRPGAARRDRRRRRRPPLDRRARTTAGGDRRAHRAPGDAERPKVDLARQPSRWRHGSGVAVEPFDGSSGDDVPGVIGRSADGRVEVDATLPVRLAHARIRFAERVAHLLGVDA